MKAIRLLLISVACISAAIAQPIVLNGGAYQLIRARGPGGQTDGVALSSVVVNIAHKQGKVIISIDGGETEVRTDDQQGFLVALPYRPDQKGILASHLILAGRSVTPGESGPSRRVEGIYRIIWPGGEEKGDFAVVPLPPKSG